MASPIEFLRHILPDEGFYVSHTITAAARFNRFHQSLPALADYLLTADAEGHTVYHGCASYKENKHNSRGLPASERKLGRTHHNVLWISSLWGDLDAGPDKPYPDRDAALEALYHFLRATHLPNPTCVGSGNGVHIYWPLDLQLRPDVWLTYATGLRALFHQKGLQVDPARTCDASSILRTPGTHWRKQGEREVVCGNLNGPYGEELEFLKDVAEPGRSPRYVNGHRTQRLVADALVLFNNDKADGGRVADGCGQVGRMRATGGNVVEPHWYAVLGVLAHCDDGDRLGHEWSSGYPGYTDAETTEKLNRAKEFGPTTCAKFAAVNPAGCTGCPFQGKITSPIELGRHRASLSVELPQHGERRVEAGNRDDVPNGERAFHAIKLPFGFQWNAYGSLVALSEHNRGALIEHVISTHPVYLDRINQGETKGDFSATFRHYSPATKWDEITIPNKTLLSSGSGIGELADKGVVIHDEQNFKRYVRGHLDMLKQEEKLAIRYDQFGWKEDRFLYGLNLYGPDGCTPAAGSPELEYRVSKHEIGVAPGAKLSVWTSAVEGLFAKGAEPQSVSMLASFAAPLVRLVEIDEGGCLLHYVTPETGKGKTVALLGAISVWGRKWGISSHSGDTQVSKGLTRGVISNLPVFNDELLLRDPTHIIDYIKTFTDGRDKLRANRSGQLVHNSTGWQTVLISAANQSMRDVIGDHAMRWRVIELSSDLPKEVKMSQGEAFKAVLRENSGIAGDYYLRYITQPKNLEQIRKQLHDLRNTLLDSKKWGKPDYRYWIRFVTCAAVAGDICRRIGLLHFDPQRILMWLEDHLPFEGVQERSWAVDEMSEYLRAKSKTGTLYMPGPWEPGVDPPPRPIQLPSHELLIRREDKGGRYYIAIKPFQAWLIEREKSYTELVRTLVTEKVILDKNKLITLGANSELSGPQVRCLMIDGLHPMMAEVNPSKR